MAAYYGDKKYEGQETIVVAMDIGTTNTAVSFTHLCPGSRPQGKMVAHWPGQANWSGAAKIPSIVSYINGVAKAYGNEAQQDFEGNHSEVAYWFKLHLHPTTMLKLSDSQGFEIPALPVNTTIEGVYTDLMRYLMKNTQRVFQMVTPDGEEIWSRLRDAIVIVLAIPNGWAIAEQAILSRAAIKASLVTEENAGHLLHFVAEAEASVHYALAKQEGQWLKRNTVFAVIDCGGSTIDTTVYRCVSTDPLRLKEACPSECVQAGGIFINREVEKLLKEKLRDSAFDDPEIMRIMMSAFEKELKPTFDGITEEYSFRFGSIKDDDSSLGIAKGRITLLDRELKPAFDLVIEKMIASCFHILVEQKTKYLILVGGFAESPYMQNVLWKRLAQHEIAPIMGVDYAKKAAAEGAIIAHIKQFVVARVVKATIGGCVRESYNKKLHRERKHLARLYPE
ncbi:hypothetical protein M408DRAFT_262852 [Serendipita vermifera MAFF 305830]|uniref:Actin-like ATPase domain-containing protein n=1 Tax=Serendipita vermifera MAFF 305830 TaxID=933852 RepID=A0A0C2WAR3_SERVB|nr:hypothetical protein M408DRAFT_262852 [Serendipita vermifera MAFF 305830]